jgi:hypothetical protein
VIDPSLFDGPVPQATWVNKQGDPYAITVPTNASVYHRSYGGSISYDDANYNVGAWGREDPSPLGEGMNRAPLLCRKL